KVFDLLHAVAIIRAVGKIAPPLGDHAIEDCADALEPSFGIGKARGRRRQPQQFLAPAMSLEKDFEDIAALAQRLTDQAAAVGSDQNVEYDKQRRRFRSEFAQILRDSCCSAWTVDWTHTIERTCHPRSTHILSLRRLSAGWMRCSSASKEKTPSCGTTNSPS